jgi:hypothetical protein
VVNLRTALLEARPSVLERLTKFQLHKLQHEVEKNLEIVTAVRLARIAEIARTKEENRQGSECSSQNSDDSSSSSSQKPLQQQTNQQSSSSQHSAIDVVVLDAMETGEFAGNETDNGSVIILDDSPEAPSPESELELN